MQADTRITKSVMRIKDKMGAHFLKVCYMFPCVLCRHCMQALEQFASVWGNRPPVAAGPSGLLLLPPTTNQPLQLAELDLQSVQRVYLTHTR